MLLSAQNLTSIPKFLANYPFCQSGKYFSNYLPNVLFQLSSVIFKNPIFYIIKYNYILLMDFKINHILIIIDILIF